MDLIGLINIYIYNFITVMCYTHAYNLEILLSEYKLKSIINFLSLVLKLLIV